MDAVRCAECDCENGGDECNWIKPGRDAVTALRTLIEAVEAGEFPHGINGAARAVFPYAEREADDLGLTAAAAFDGSVDAALALMEAVLPGWVWALDCEPGFATALIFKPNGDELYLQSVAKTDTPARAILLAILKAMEATNAGKE